MSQTHATNAHEGRSSPNLLKKIQQRTAKVGIVGLGYVGLPTMVACARAGLDVTGIDINQERVEKINAGISYIEDVSGESLDALVQQGKISCTTDYRSLALLDIIIICVPTPVNKHKEPDLGPLQHALYHLSENMQGEQLVILQSTTFPGTTEELALPQLGKTGRREGEDFYLVFSPERVDPGNQQYTLQNTPKVVGGVTPRCTELGSAFFSTFVDKVIPVRSPRVAEMTKLLENTFRSVNIALVNELSEVCQRMDIDVWEVVNAASSKPFGFMSFSPGIGVGGHCIAVDPFYLSWKAKEYDCYVNFIDLAARINDNRPYYVVSRIVDILGARETTLNHCHLLLLGMSFKKDISDIRNSPALRVAELLTQKGARISYSDQYVPEIPLNNHVVSGTALGQSILGQYDATIILVNHTYLDMEEIVRHSKLVIDAVDATKLLPPNPKVIKL